MSFLSNIKNRLHCLPKLRADNLALYVAYRALMRILVSRNIIDHTGRLTKPRNNKPRFVKQNNTFSKLVSVGGFGWSGSSAVVDLLSEYDGVTTQFVGVSEDSSNQPLPTVPEFELARAAGGLFQLEHVFETPSFFERDAGVRIFVELAEWLYLNTRSFYGEEFIQETRKFLDRLIATRAENGGDGFDYCHHLSGLGGRSVERFLGLPKTSGKRYVFYLKDMSVAEYRKIAREYISSVLHYLKSDEMMVLDQATSDESFDMGKYTDYFGPIKVIFVWRDPSDVYAQTNSSQKLAYLPIEPNGFVNWYKANIERALAVKNENWLAVRFENLLFSYDREVKRIEDFLDLSDKAHIRKQTALVTSENIFNSVVGLWKAYPDQKAIGLIRSELRDYCFDRP